MKHIALLTLIAFVATPAAAQSIFTPVDGGDFSAERANTGGVSFVDANDDGHLDLFVTNGYDVASEPHTPQPNGLYLGDGAGNFTASDLGLAGGEEFSSGSAWGDINGDGLIDVVIANQRDQANAVYLGAPDGSYHRQRDDALGEVPHGSYAAGLVDVDGDGLLDVFISNGGLSHNAANELLRGRGDGTFEAVEGTALSAHEQSTGAAVWADYDNDGDQDVFVASGSAMGGQRQALFRNDGQMVFTLMTDAGLAQDFRQPISATWADVDNDLDMDLFVGTQTGFYDSLYINIGDGTFVAAPPSDITGMGSFAYGTAAGDVNNDGSIDLLVANWGAATALYLGDGTGHFTRAPMPPQVEWASSIALGDYDADGDLDVAIGNWPYGTDGQENRLLRNDGAEGRWLRVSLTGAAPNTSAIGARIVVETRGGAQMREVQTQTSWRSMSDLTQHFGLGPVSLVADVMVRWPDGSWESFGAQRADQTLTLSQGTGTPSRGP